MHTTIDNGTQKLFDLQKQLRQERRSERVYILKTKDKAQESILETYPEYFKYLDSIHSRDTYKDRTLTHYEKIKSEYGEYKDYDSVKNCHDFVNYYNNLYALYDIKLQFFDYLEDKIRFLKPQLEYLKEIDKKNIMLEKANKKLIQQKMQPVSWNGFVEYKKDIEEVLQKIERLISYYDKYVYLSKKYPKRTSAYIDDYYNELCELIYALRH